MAGDENQAVDEIKAFYRNKGFSEDEISVRTFNEMNFSLYDTENRNLKLLAIFTLLTLLLTILAMFAMSTYYARQHAREAALRKVMGSSRLQLFVETSAGFLKSVGISLVVALPVAWMAADKWLEGYNYRIDNPVYVYGAAVAVMLLVAILSISWQMIRLINTNPVNALKMNNVERINKMTIMIKVTDLSKIFRTEEIETTALNGVSFEIKEGEFVAIMGPSGCGKSTLLNILGLLDNPSGGSYELMGQEVAKLKERDRTRFRKGNIGFVFQSFNLIDELNVFENVELPLKYLNIGAGERKRRVTEILKRMNISHRAQHFPQQLSGGQQQRVAIARAVVSNPKLVLADEPTGNLDSRNGKEVMDLLTELNSEGTTIVMVTHSQKDASVAQRTINLFDGQIVSDVRNEL